MNEEILNYTQDIKFTLGHAGTGKSTKLASEAGKRTIVLTPTHRAKEVLLDKGVINVSTIHSVLGLIPTIDDNFRKRGNLQKLKQIGGVELKHVNRIIIDEFSMINTFILDLLLEVLPAKAEVSIYGDPYQLPPVDGDKVDPEFYQTKGIETLTTQYRAEAPEVVETFTRFVDFLANPIPNADLTLNKAIVHGGIRGFNPDTDRALAFTNKKVIEINNRIARSLKLPKEISIGEEVVINGLMGTLVKRPDHMDYLTIYPKCVSKGQLMDGDDLLDAIDSVEADMEKYNQDIINGTAHFIKIEETVYEFYGDVDHYAHNKQYASEVEDAQFELISERKLGEEVNLKEWCKYNRSDPLTKQRGRAWSTFLGHQGRTWDYRRPFCTTVHKAQGSEFQTVYIDQADIKKAIRGGYYENYARLMYVALSRAIEKVVII